MSGSEKARIDAKADKVLGKKKSDPQKVGARLAGYKSGY
jgi:hypothetical protein